MSFEPGPQALHRVPVLSARWQERGVDVSYQTVAAVAHEPTPVRFPTVPDDQQRCLPVGLECTEEFDDLFFLEAAFVQAEMTVGSYGCRDGASHSRRFDRRST